MRLTCPNCSAEYEVDAALIPDDGRDVQCSNCGKTWFELPPAAPSAADTTAPVVSAPVADAIERMPEDEGDADEWDEPAAEEWDEPAAEAPEEELPEPPATPDAPAPRRVISSPITAPAPEPSAASAQPSAPIPAPAPKRRDVDPRALDILKEEADRELANRRKEREAVEVQSEFDLTAQDSAREPSRALRARMARLRGESDPRPQRPTTRQSEGAGYVRPERELLPDIEEINSSLRPADADADAADAARRSEFRRGFGVMVGLSACLVVVYLAAPAIARAMPGLQPAMVAYLDAANGFRDFVDGMLR